jgi:hypothetical protein
MFLIAVGLLAVDGCATAWLLACRHRRRVQFARLTAPSRAALARRAAADALNEDLLRRQTVVRSQAAERAAQRDAERAAEDAAEWPDVRSASRSAFAPLVRPSLPSTARRIDVSAQLLEAANLLAATASLTYDPATWERRA